MADSSPAGSGVRFAWISPKYQIDGFRQCFCKVSSASAVLHAVAQRATVASCCGVLQCWASLGELELVYLFLPNEGGIWVNMNGVAPLPGYGGNASHLALQ